MKRKSEEARLSKVFNAASGILRQIAKKYLLPAYNSETIKVKMNSDGTQGVEAEMVAEIVARRSLKKKFPNIGFYGEKYGQTGLKEVRWIYDPVDGTDLYVRKIGSWSSMIALEAYGRIVFGIIYLPVTDDYYWAYAGHGAFFNHKPIHVSNRRSLNSAFLVHSGLMQLLSDYRSSWLGNFSKIFRGVRAERGYSDFVGWMLVADGRADIGLHFGLGLEDIAAPKIIIEEAGGRVTDWEGQDNINSHCALATNGRLHDKVLQLLKR